MKNIKITGTVIKGKQLGTKIGFPTINIQVQNTDIKKGTYLSKVKYNNEIFDGMSCLWDVNDILILETNIFNFDKMIYGETVEVELTIFLRDNIEIKSEKELIQLLEKDRENCINIINKKIPLLGSHVQNNKKNDYLIGSVNEAIGYNANTFMIFTGPPQSFQRIDTSNFNIDEMNDILKKENINKNNLVVHAPYLINIGNSVKKSTWDFSVEFLIKEIKRCNEIGIKILVLHPGAYTTGVYKDSLDQIVKALNIVSAEQKDLIIALETMSGKGTEVCSKIEDFQYILSKLENKDKIGVCIDTCHMWDAGYDIKNNWNDVKNEIKQKIGLDKIYCIHLNDSKNDIFSHKDRHENIGHGYIGFDTLCNIVWDEDFKNIPKILETPYVNDESVYKIEINNLVNKKFLNKVK